MNDEQLERILDALEDRSRDLHDAEDHVVEPWERCEEHACKADRKLLNEARTPEAQGPELSW